MSKKKETKKTMCVTVMPSVIEKVKLLAEKENRTVSNYVETLILKQELIKK